MMKTYNILNNYLIFGQLHADSIGVNYRGAGIEDNRPVQHQLITEMNPIYTMDETTWKRVSVLLEGIKKSNITHLYSPDKIVRSKEATLLIFPYLKGKTLENILEDAAQKEVPINFDLAFSMVTAIADIIDMGSSIVVSGKKSFHGFLTPDNIIIDYDGNIYLKNYGIAPYLTQSDNLYKEMEMKYGSWLTPEYQQREKIVPQSDIYHLGYTIYRILTGTYFSYTQGEDFDAKFSNISFSHFMPTTDKDYLTNMINFFKKTLHPEPSKRFSHVRELKDYISNYFKIEELSSVTFSLAYFMNSLYAETMEEETTMMAGELNYEIPEPGPEVEEKTAEERARADNEIVEKILTGLEETEKSRSKLLLPLIIILIAVVGIAGFLYISQANKAKQEQLKVQQELERKLALIQQQTKTEYEEKLKSLEEQITTTEEEQKAKEDEISKLKAWRQEQERKEQESKQAIEQAKKLEELEAEKKRIEEEKRKREEEAEQKRLEEEKRKQQEEAEKKLQEEKERVVTEGELIDIEFATQKPILISGEDPDFSRSIRKKYKGMQMNITCSLLIDERGNVSRVKIKGNVEPEIKLVLSTTLANWKYKSAQKNEVKVKVWLDVPITLTF
jgi:serine/threonine protein kinase